MAFSSSSSCPVFFSFLTKLFTAFSHHFSSCPFCSPPPAPAEPPADFFHPRSLFTTGGVNGSMDDMTSTDRTLSTQLEIPVWSLKMQTKTDILALRLYLIRILYYQMLQDLPPPNNSGNSSERESEIHFKVWCWVYSMALSITQQPTDSQPP